MDRGRFPRDRYEHDDDSYDTYDHDAYASSQHNSYTGEDGAYSYESAAYTGYDNAYDTSYSAEGRALLPVDENGNLPALASEQMPVTPVIIPGSGVSMGTPFIKRRERPLTLRLTVLALTACILVSGLFAVTPLGSSADAGISSFQALSGAVVWKKTVSYHWYIAQSGDTLESISTAQHVQIGGIYELNGLFLGQEVQTGIAYKIPDDPFYGKGFKPRTLITQGSGATTFGDSPWTSNAGTPTPEQPCGPNGNGNPTAYKLVSPNPGSHWVRGFTYYHNGIDIAAPQGNKERAAQAGQVIWAGWDFYGLGYSVKINNCNHISTIYGHMIQIIAKVGQFVQPGDIIGLEGSTGFSTGPHLHFMVLWDNVPVDPMQFYGGSICKVTGTC